MGNRTSLGLAFTVPLLAACGGSENVRSSETDITASTNIEHVVLIVQENHTFDSYFGSWCTAPSGSNPSCTQGPSCCEAAPARDPSGAAPVTLDDSENAAYDPNHDQSCELQEIDNGKMDHFVSGTSCSSANNFAIAPSAAMQQYWSWAGQYAIADRWFQPIAGASSSNDMYLATARFVFLDNAYQPNTNGRGCDLPPTPTKEYKGQTTIADLLLKGGKTFAAYAEGYHAMVSSWLCPAAPSDCTMTPFRLPTPPCDYSPGDIPFEFYSQFADNSKYMKDLNDLTTDIQNGTLPNFSFVKPVGYKSEHPGYGTTIANGVKAVKQVVDLIENSAFANDTLVLLTWDEGGGFFDHVAPPPTSTVDNQPYGMRVPVLAIGRFARKGSVSHVVMEHSSILKFLELNFLGTTGQLGARDTNVANIGSLLDPTQTGIVVPEN
ncbi:MAG TPA: alkaline phosphatase family protein [Polyangiaceae bacterium]|nr:alkaline phosphatase family protein [Polyangiaceae bacterium]